MSFNYISSDASTNKVIEECSNCSLIETRSGIRYFEAVNVLG
ncbi:5667_t:CDS:2, partial [Gigaspora rosea]